MRGECLDNNRRKDRMSPCHGCKDRYPACSDHCTKPEYLDWKKLEAARKADHDRRQANERADRQARDQRFRIRH